MKPEYASQVRGPASARTAHDACSIIFTVPVIGIYLDRYPGNSAIRLRNLQSLIEGNGRTLTTTSFEAKRTEAISAPLHRSDLSGGRMRGSARLHRLKDSQLLRKE